MAGQSKSPSNPLLPEHRIHVLLFSANDLGFRATIREIKVVARCDASPWHRDVMPCNCGGTTPLRLREVAAGQRANSSGATATITTTAAMKISVPLFDMRHIARRRRPIADEPPILDNPAASAAVVRCKTIKQAA